MDNNSGHSPGVDETVGRGLALGRGMEGYDDVAVGELPPRGAKVKAVEALERGKKGFRR